MVQLSTKLLILAVLDVTLANMTTRSDLTDPVHGVKMGIPRLDCDDGVTNTTIDWDNSEVNYTCFEDVPYPVRSDVGLIIECEVVPVNSTISKHYCMDVKLQYNHTEPVFGYHRPLWPMYGEYQFVPPQRWLHSVEHGGVVMLYHPCADPVQVDKLRQLVRGCMRRHVITPHNYLTRERPLALVIHRCRFYMATVDATEVRQFIRQRALKSREGHEVRDGQYNLGLVVPAEIPSGSDIHESVICPGQ